MTEAINVFYYIFDKIYNFVFNEAIFVENVSIGWVFIVVNVFIILINSILNQPTGDRNRSHRVYEKYERNDN